MTIVALAEPEAEDEGGGGRIVRCAVVGASAQLLGYVQFKFGF